MRKLNRAYQRERQRGRGYSALAHLVLFALAVFGLPSFLEPKPPAEPQAVSVEILPISSISNVKPTESKPAEEKKPEPKPEPPKEEKKPTPPVKTQTPTPPPPPEPVPTIKKPEEKKPEEKKKKDEKKEEKKKKPKEEDLDAVLKAVKDTAQKKKDDTPKETTDANEKKATSQNYTASLPMSLSEQDAIRSQIAKCWNVPAGAKDAQDLIVILRLQLEEDGSVIKVELANESKSRYASDSFFRSAADSAMRAVRQCSPLKNLPPEKYGTWRDIELTFDPREMLQ